MSASVTLLESIERLRRCSRSDIRVISEKTGLPFHTLCKIATGETKDPRVSTIQALTEYYEAADVTIHAAHDEQEAA